MKNYNWLFYLGLACLGLLVLIFPSFWINLVVFVVGLGSVAYGLYNLIFTRRIFQDSMYETVILVKAVFCIVIGLISVIIPLAVAEAMWKSMIYVLIVYLLLAAVMGFYSVSLLKSTEIDRKKYIFENLALLVLAAVLIIISPEKLGIFIIRLIGLALFLFSLLMIALQFMLEKNTVTAGITDIKDSSDEEDEKDQ